MKALRLAMIAVLLAGTMVCLANADGGKNHAKKVVNITLAQALQKPELVAAIKAQVDPSMLGNDGNFYTATVNYDGVIYKITGSTAEWKRFFSPVNIRLSKLAKPRADF